MIATVMLKFVASLHLLNTFTNMCVKVQIVSLEVRPDSSSDEVKQSVDARWICASEAL